MADTTFIDYTQPAVNAEWLNDVNRHIYREVVNVANAPFNATGDGTTDDYAAIVAAVTYAKTLTMPELYFPPGVYNIGTNSLQIDLPNYSKLTMQGRIISQADAITALLVGSYSTPTFGLNASGLDVRRSTYDVAGSSVGIAIVNQVWGEIKVEWVEGFDIGVLLNGTAANGGVSHCQLTFNYIHDNRYNLYLTADGVGYNNENVYYGGSFGYSTTWAAVAGDYTNTYNVYVEHFSSSPLNNHVFIKPSLEAQTPDTVPFYNAGQFVHIYSPRLEVASGTATDYKILLTANSLGTIIIGGFNMVAANVEDLGSDSLIIVRDRTTTRSQAGVGGSAHVVRMLSGDASTKAYEVVNTGGTTTAYLQADGKVVGTNMRATASATGQASTVTFGNATQSTVGSAGGASALPATPSGYLRLFIGTTEYVVPYYAQA